MDDKYLSRLKSIVQESEEEKRPGEFSKIRAGYRLGIKQTKLPKYKKILRKYSDLPGDYEFEYIPQENAEAEKLLKAEKEDFTNETYSTRKIGYAMAIANKLMDSKRSMESTLLGAKVYEKIGQGNRDFVKRKLLNKFEELTKKAPGYIKTYEPIVEGFLKRNQSKKKDLEGIMVSIIFIGTLAVSIFFSSSITGNVIINESKMSFIGAIFLLILLITSFLIFRNKTKF